MLLIGGGATQKTKNREKIINQEMGIKPTDIEKLHEHLNNKTQNIEDITRLVGEYAENREVVHTSNGPFHKFDLTNDQASIELDPEGVVLMRELSDAMRNGDITDSFAIDINDCHDQSYNTMSQCISFDNDNNVEEKTVFSHNHPTRNEQSSSKSDEDGQQTSFASSRSASNQIVSFSRSASYSTSTKSNSNINRSNKKAKKDENVNQTYNDQFFNKIMVHIYESFGLSPNDPDMEKICSMFPDLFAITNISSQKARWRRFDEVAKLWEIFRNGAPYKFMLATVVYMIYYGKKFDFMEYERWYVFMC